MPTLKNVQEDLVTTLAASGLSWCGVVLASATNLWSGPEKANVGGRPDAGVFVLEYATRIMPYMGSTRQGYYQVALQVLGRSDREAERTGLVGMRALAGYLQQLTVSGYVSSRITSGPVPLGLGGDDLYRWTLNVEWTYTA